MRRAIVHFLWEGLAIVVAFCLMFFIAVWNGWIGYMPDMDTLSNPIDKFATQVYSANGKLIGTWNEDNGNRVAVDYNSISPNLVHALVATEDERFYEHSGIDYIALGRAIIKRGILGHHEAGGGSTITQQLAKQLYSEKAHGTLERMLQKPIEWIIAIKLERYFTKEEIIAMYLNYFDFLHNAVGIKRAANIYFDKEPWQLNLDESAILVGMCKNPSMFNPVRYQDRCRQRRNVVLAQMLKCGYITSEQYGQASAQPLELHFSHEKPIAGAGSYFQAFLKQYMMAELPLRETILPGVSASTSSTPSLGPPTRSMAGATRTTSAMATTTTSIPTASVSSRPSTRACSSMPSRPCASMWGVVSRRPSTRRTTTSPMRLSPPASRASRSRIASTAASVRARASSV